MGGRRKKCFKDVKDAFLRVTILKHPNMTLRFFVQAEASSHGIGACLFQLDRASGERNTIACTSPTLQPAELWYRITKRIAGGGV